MPSLATDRNLDGQPACIPEVFVLDVATLDAVNRRRRRALLLHWALRPLGYLEFSDLYSIDLARLPPCRPLDGYALERADAADIDELCSSLPLEEAPSVLRRLWLEGHHCFVARCKGRIVAYDWIAFGPVQEQEYRVELQAGHTFCLDAYTAPDHRGRGIHTCLLHKMLQFAAAEGKTKAFTVVSLFNRSSWKSHLRLGWAREHTVCYFRPYFTPRRLPWQIVPVKYPLRLDWEHHSWFAEFAP